MKCVPTPNNHSSNSMISEHIVSISPSCIQNHFVERNYLSEPALRNICSRRGVRVMICRLLFSKNLLNKWKKSKFFFINFPTKFIALKHG